MKQQTLALPISPALGSYNGHKLIDQALQSSSLKVNSELKFLYWNRCPMNDDSVIIIITFSCKQFNNPHILSSRRFFSVRFYLMLLCYQNAPTWLLHLPL